MKIEEVLRMCDNLYDLETLKEQAQVKFSKLSKDRKLDWKSFWAGYYQAHIVRAQNHE